MAKGSKKSNEKYILRVVEQSGLSKREAKRDMKRAQKELGISFKDYAVIKLWSLPVEKQRAYYEKELERRRINEERRQKCLKKTIKATGWDEATAAEHIKQAKKQYGVKYSEYTKFRLWRFEIDKVGDKYLKLKEKEERLVANAQIVAKRSGLPFDDAKKRLRSAEKNFKISHEEFINYRLWRFEEEQVEERLLKIKKNEAQLEESAQKVAEKSGLTVDEAKKRLKAAKKSFGIKQKEYIKFRLWRFDEEQLGEKYLEIKKKEAQLEKNAQKVAEKSGLTVDEAKKRLRSAEKNFKINHKEYIKFRLWRYDDERVEERYLALKRDAEKFEENASIVAEKSGLTVDEAKKRLKAAKRNHGISNKTFISYRLWKYEDEQIVERYQKKKAEREQIRAELNAAAEQLAAAKDCSQEEAKEIIKEAKPRLDIGFDDFVKYNLYKYPEEEQLSVLENAVCSEARQADKLRKKDIGYINGVVEATGWSFDEAKRIMDEAYDASGVSYEHYLIYRFWELPVEEQKKYFSKGDADKLNKKFNKDREIRRSFQNKEIFCKKFEKFLGRISVPTKELTSLEAFKEKFGDYRKIIYKPAALSGGRGIEVYEYDESTIADIYQIISELSPGVIENYLIQHHEIQQLTVNAVNTLRVVTIMTKEPMTNLEPGKIYFAYMGLRMAIGDGYTDNLHTGGIMAICDVETGELVTNGSDFKNRVFEEHPVTGVKINGFKIPFFNEIKELIREAGKDSPGYLGWDIALTEEGPVIIEVNTHPGADGLQTPYVPMKHGARHIVEKFINAKQPDSPFGTKISRISDEGIELYWKKLENVDGYEVHRGYSPEGPFEKIAQIDRRRVGTYVDNEFDHSAKSVYYTINTFLKNDDETLCRTPLLMPAVEAVYTEQLVLERENIYMYSGAERKINAVYGWGDAQNTVWTSSDESVATVDCNGNVVAVAKGSCEITCSIDDGEQSATINIVVDREAPQPLTQPAPKYRYNESSSCYECDERAESEQAVILMVGDLMCGSNQMLKQGLDDGTWNFNDSFEHIREITAEADLSIANFETLLAAGWPYMIDESYIKNMNNCNAPARYLDAVYYGGFDAVTLSNNHNCDGGVRALQETIEQVKKYEMPFTGVFSSDDDKRYTIFNVNGIKVGLLAYMSPSTGFNGKEKSWSEEERDRYLNIFSEEKAKRDIENCRKDGAEYVIAYMHWGGKNFKSITPNQQREAMGIANAGADFIVGANPHVLQKYDVLKADDGREVPCYYSVGNFQAYMRQVPENRDTIIARICLVRDEGGRVVLKENGYIPCGIYTKISSSWFAPVSLVGKYNRDLKREDRIKIARRVCQAIGDKIQPYLG